MLKGFAMIPPQPQFCQFCTEAKPSVQRSEVRAAVVAGFYPQIARVERPPPRFAAARHQVTESILLETDRKSIAGLFLTVCVL